MNAGGGGEGRWGLGVSEVGKAGVDGAASEEETSGEEAVCRAGAGGIEGEITAADHAAGGGDGDGWSGDGGAAGCRGSTGEGEASAGINGEGAAGGAPFGTSGCVGRACKDHAIENGIRAAAEGKGPIGGGLDAGAGRGAQVARWCLQAEISSACEVAEEKEIACAGEVEVGFGVDIACAGEKLVVVDAQTSRCGAGEGAAKDEVGGELAVGGVAIEVRGVDTSLDEGADLGWGEVAAELEIGCSEVGVDGTGGVDDAAEDEVFGAEGCGSGAVQLGVGSGHSVDGACGVEIEVAGAGGSERGGGLEVEVSGAVEGEISA